ncbi:asparagine synthase (glutamine-hydrolyzing) [Butyrivibrio sp. CB08]|uniref:asparagine synthase (glutamine-hydrolyzing) n=1 Tax=Butyrivibrio sp. CB08 TaxID=2364879 RepID=UPI000EA8AD89|nr:asparagine synthase (glutamine-hydrolyzing) [Butyrivibrio sp. CB08]RKM57888.1 asparagine synthase (glutamine-hydrolyzing) [Butyrivibrio sp. CB08]
MCGIAGIVGKDRDKDIREKIGRMLAVIVHRGPDGNGSFFYDDRIGLGHRRLSIIDLTDNGAQPMTYLGRYHITYNGEIYNYLELRDELEKAGFTFTTHTDTEVLLAAYCKWGADCVNHLNGMWAFAIFDEKEERIFASRDRYGVKPFYYHIADNTFIFASEIKEILELLPRPIRADKSHFYAFLANGSFDYDEGTMFDGIKQLIGGHNLILDCRTLENKIYRWYDLRKVQENSNSKEENEQLFHDKFEKAIKLRLRSDVPVGSCLSGGLDSSSIVCMVHNVLSRTTDNGNHDLAAISSCFEDKKYDEQEYIDEVIKETGAVSHKIFPDMNEAFNILDKIIWHMDEPFPGLSVYAQWCVFAEAKRQGLTVMLDGQGADEQLAGYTPFYKVLFIELMKKRKWQKLRTEINAYRTLRSDTEADSFGEIMMSTLTSLLLPDSIRYKLNKIYVKRVIGLPLPTVMYKNKSIEQSYRAYNKRNARQYVYAGMHDGLRTLLHFEDRNSMAHSIESRVPFLDYELAEFIYSVPLEHKIENGRTKNLIREGLRNIIPKAIYNRISKLGFVTPEDKWLKENETFFYNELEKACDRLDRILDKPKVLSWYSDHVQSTRMGDTTCFRIICAAHWAEVFGVEFG